MSHKAVSSPDQDAQIARLQGQIDARDRVIEMLRTQLARLRRMTFSTSSKKLAKEIEQLELALEEYESEAAIADVNAPNTAKSDRPAPVRSLLPHLPPRGAHPRARHRRLHLPIMRRCASPSEHRCRRDARCRAGQLARRAQCPAQV